MRGRARPTHLPHRIRCAVKAAGIGLVLAVAIGYVWSRYPDWGFYLALVLGFSIAESMAWAAKGKRGVDLQVLGIVLVAFALVLSRYLLFDRFGLSLSQYADLNERGKEVLHVKLIPDGLFAVMPLLIVWYRFR